MSANPRRYFSSDSCGYFLGPSLAAEPRSYKAISLATGRSRQSAVPTGTGRFFEHVPGSSYLATIRQSLPPPSYGLWLTGRDEVRDAELFWVLRFILLTRGLETILLYRLR
jgi:hypothetical protein